MEYFRPKEDDSDKHTEYVLSKKFPYLPKRYTTCRKFSFKNTYLEDFEKAIQEILKNSQYKPVLFLVTILDKEYDNKDEFFLF